MFTIHAGRQGTHLMFELPRVCPKCAAFTCWFINLNGRTFCVRCIEEKQHANHAA